MIATDPAPMTFHSLALESRALGAYLGFAVGDALGATVEFMTEGEINVTYGVHREIVGGGWLRLKRGQVTDDTQLCLALGEALLACNGWNLRVVADGFVRWMRSRPVDIGHTCRRGIRRYMLHGSLSAEPAADSAGNGAAMRNLPLALATLFDAEAFAERSLAQAHLTHHHPFSDLATLALGRITQQLVCGGSRAEVRESIEKFVAQQPVFRFAPWPGHTSGYIVDTVQTVLDAFSSTTSFEDCVVRAVNRGGDADTAGALAGQLAGACYGATAIPRRWLRRLDPTVHSAIHDQTPGLLALAERGR
jgi:ADP-ribosyl-[dinitrogen reductase] hydrolase